jgi:predicted RNA binding protein YcfA (HicA-like mRNA interferase family)
MKIPRDISGQRLARYALRNGYVFVRQTGSHARFTHPGPPQTHIVIPMHDFLKIGTLQDILKTICEQRGLILEQILRDL